MSIKTIDPKSLSPAEILSLLTDGVAPRPIALVSTVSKEGNHNVAPFSFFNAFGANPPMVAFSPARRGRDGSTKDTYENLLATEECVIQVVPYSIVEQVNLSSADFPPDVDEFKKSGLTPIPAQKVKAMRVQESPFQMECKLFKMVDLGGKPGSGNLAICEVVLFHVSEEVWDGKKMDPHKLDLVARNGGIYYTRASGPALFEVPRPVASTSLIGYDGLPKFIKKSEIFTGNDLARLGNVTSLPSTKEVKAFGESFSPLVMTPKKWKDADVEKNYKELFRMALSLKQTKKKESSRLMEQAAKSALGQNDVDFAWKVVLYSQL